MNIYNYSEKPIEGTSRLRARQITIVNPLDGPPSIAYIEQKVTAIDQDTDCTDVGIISAEVTLGDEIELRDLSTGQLTGNTIPVALVYQALFSDYITRAEARDAAQAE